MWCFFLLLFKLMFFFVVFIGLIIVNCVIYIELNNDPGWKKDECLNLKIIFALWIIMIYVIKSKMLIVDIYFSSLDFLVSSTSALSNLISKPSNCDGKCPAKFSFSPAISSCKNSINAFSPESEKKKIHFQHVHCV